MTYCDVIRVRSPFESRPVRRRERGGGDHHAGEPGVTWHQEQGPAGPRRALLLQHSHHGLPPSRGLQHRDHLQAMGRQKLNPLHCERVLLRVQV